MHLLNEHCATSELTALYFMYNHFLFNCFKSNFKINFYIILKLLVLLFLTSCFIAVNDYFTFFYVKHFELPMCMKCAIQITCLALPCLTNPSFFLCWFMCKKNKHATYDIRDSYYKPVAPALCWCNPPESAPSRRAGSRTWVSGAGCGRSNKERQGYSL